MTGGKGNSPMPSSLTYPGVYVEELPSTVRTITGVPTSIAAFVGRAWRGPVDDPTEIDSYADFERTFGGLWRSSALSYAVQQFFANGGSQALIVRVVNRTDVANVAAATAKFTLATGTKLEAASPGSWGNDLVLTVDGDVSPDLPADAGRFNLAVFDDPDRKEDARKVGGSGARETFLNVSVTPTSPRYVLTVLAERSRLVKVLGGLGSNVGSAAPTADPRDHGERSRPRAGRERHRDRRRRGQCRREDRHLRPEQGGHLQPAVHPAGHARLGRGQRAVERRCDAVQGPAGRPSRGRAARVGRAHREDERGRAPVREHRRTELRRDVLPAAPPRRPAPREPPRATSPRAGSSPGSSAGRMRSAASGRRRQGPTPRSAACSASRWRGLRPISTTRRTAP